VRAVVFLAQDGTRRVPVGEIADALSVPQNYLSKVLNALAHHGVLTSVRGARGGFRLSRPPAETTLAEVVRPFGAMTNPPRCLLLDKPCSDSTPCIAHREWKDVARQVQAFFGTKTLADLLASGAPGFVSRVPTPM
jgi:Rrf2 family protein